MSQSCGGIDFVEGGTLKSVTILGSQITDSRITGSVFESGQIESLTSIDSSSAKTIADAIAGLSADQLKTLAEAIFAALSATPGATPVGTEDGALPTTIHGNRDALLGKPDMFAQFDARHVMPLYRV